MAGSRSVSLLRRASSGGSLPSRLMDWVLADWLPYLGSAVIIVAGIIAATLGVPCIGIVGAALVVSILLSLWSRRQRLKWQEEHLSGLVRGEGVRRIVALTEEDYQAPQRSG